MPLPAATLVDVVGSLALVTQSNRSGVSLAINTLYLNPMPGAYSPQWLCWTCSVPRLWVVAAAKDIVCTLC